MKLKLKQNIGMSVDIEFAVVVVGGGGGGWWCAKSFSRKTQTLVRLS